MSRDNHNCNYCPCYMLNGMSKDERREQIEGFCSYGGQKCKEKEILDSVHRTVLRTGDLR